MPVLSALSDPTQMIGNEASSDYTACMPPANDPERGTGYRAGTGLV